MGIYIFPIFLFGCAVTAIVFLGIQQAHDWAKDEAAQNAEAGRDSANTSTRESATETTVNRN